MAPTLDEALAALLEGRPTVTPAPDTPPAEPAAPAPPPAPGPPAPAPTPPSGDRDELLQQATDALNAAETAARNGDWARYGTELQRARDALQRAQNP
ncbi:MAG TPA: hypothetical protein VHI31_06170 [Actinomycetota bacterium]|nr:hypothetical protein [Actinomycetota bacterium]